MHTTPNTIYRLATPADFPACQALEQAQFDTSWPLGFPTIVAERNGEIIGLFSTNLECDWAHMAGPLALKRPSAIVAMRLIEFYEFALRQLSIPAYVFFVSAWNDHWLKQARLFGKQIRSNDKNLFFERSLT